MSKSTQLRRALSLSACAVALSFGGAVLAQESPAAGPASPTPVQVATVAPSAAAHIAPPATAPAASPPVQAVAPAPAPAAAPPQVAFSAQLVEAASAFETYTRNAAVIRADFAGGGDVRAALQAGARYEPEQLEAGQVAFAAIIALQDPDFVAGVRDLAANAQAADMLLVQPSSVARVGGAEGAARLVSAALRARGGLVLKTGRAVKQAAYDVQHQSWSLAQVADAAQALQQTKAMSLVRFKPAAQDTGLLIKTAQDAAQGDRSQGEGGLGAPVVQRGLALAALAVLGQAGDGAETRLQPLLTEVESAQCLKMSKLNLYQCLSVAGPHYEDVFCLGQHALIDTGQCVIDSAGVAPVAAPPPVTLASNAGWGGGAPQQGSLIPVATTRMAAQSK